MREKINSLLSSVKAAGRWVSGKTASLGVFWTNTTAPVRENWARITAPIRSGWAKATAPVKRLFSPITNRISVLTAPIRERWTAFKEKYPKSGTAILWGAALFRWGVYFVLLLILCVGLGFFGPLPSTDELRRIETANTTEVYTADSVLIGKFYQGENRTAVSLDNVSPYIINALIATEDRRFLTHSGIDVWSWFRVGLGIVTGKGMGGGSTLSQQLVKNLYGRRNYHVPGLSLVINKIRENFTSIRLEKVYNKQELLNLYLNTVPFGGDVYGISVASQQYFGKKPKDLTVDQAAALVGMLKGTSIYHPVRRPERSKQRRNVVLMQMVRNNHLTMEEYQELSQKPVGAKNYSFDGSNDGNGRYFREYLRTDLMPKILRKIKNESDKAYNLYTDGLKIYTTLDSRMQICAEDAVRTHMAYLQEQFDKHWAGYKNEKPWGEDKWIDQQVKTSNRWSALEDGGLTEEQILTEFEKPVDMTIFSWEKGGGEIDTTMSPIDSVRYYFCLLNCGFMAMDHTNGHIKAWVGGIDFRNFKLDHVEGTRRQVGSTFKPIVYAAAIQDTFTPCSYLPNEIKMIVDWEPHNVDEQYGGHYSLTGGLTKSVNVIAAQLIEKVGIQKTIELAEKMGVTSELKREFGISLGATEISLYEMIKVYGTFANQGKRPEPVTVVKVIDRNGKVIFDFEKELEANPNLGPHVEALTSKQAATMVEMMKNVINHGTGMRLRRYVGYDAEFAGKTGTTQDNSDGWFICYNAKMVTGAWVGAESPRVRFKSMYLGQGSATALPIVGLFWRNLGALNDKELNKVRLARFPKPKPEIFESLECEPWINVGPDTFALVYNIQDSVLRDSMIKYYTTVRDEEEGGDTPGAEKTDDTEDKPIKKMAEKVEGVIRKIFNKNDEKGEKEQNNNN